MHDEANPPGMNGRPHHQRVPPVTIEDHLSRAYAARFRLEGSESEDWPAVVIRLANAGFTKPALQSRREALAPIECRCVVSLTQREALDAALALMP